MVQPIKVAEVTWKYTPFYYFVSFQPQCNISGALKNTCQTSATSTTAGLLHRATWFYLSNLVALVTDASLVGGCSRAAPFLLRTMR